MTDALLDIEGLSVSFPRGDIQLKPVDQLDLQVHAGQVLGIVGESGSGKSLTALAIMNLIPAPGQIAARRLRFAGTDLGALSPRARRRHLGRDLAMIFQDPTTSLNPSFTVGFQLDEVLAAHTTDAPKARRRRALELLDAVGIPDPEQRIRAYPHELSGGMSQRVMIAIAIACGPRLLIADEPTTALDVTIQAQILSLLGRLSAELDMALILISHDLAVVSETADALLVMYCGQVVEQGPAQALLNHPCHPYTAALLASQPLSAQDAHLGQGSRPAQSERLGRRGRPDRLPALGGIVPPLHALPQGCRFYPRCPKVQPRCQSEVPQLRSNSADDAERVGIGARPRIRCHFPLVSGEKLDLTPDSAGPGRRPVLAVRDLAKGYPIAGGLGRPQRVLQALDGVTFSVYPGHSLAIVGESGSGKSTLARQLVGIEQPTRGEIWFEGKNAANPKEGLRRTLHRQVRLIFQDPYSSLNPRMSVGALLAEPLRSYEHLTARERRALVADWLQRVGLRADAAERYPHMFSGGQRQRIAIARALIVEPRVVVADEPVSALDVSIQSQILNLLAALQEEFGLAYVFISHDLGVIRHVADAIAVMYLGRIVEHGPAKSLFEQPWHPYTQALLASTPRIGTGKRVDRSVPTGELPSPLAPPPGCAFHRRCPLADTRCEAERPELINHGGRHVACHHAPGAPAA